MSSEIDNKNYFGDNFNNKKNHNNCTSNSKEFPFCINTQSSGVGSKKKAISLKYSLNLELLTWICKLGIILFSYRFMIYIQKQCNTIFGNLNTKVKSLTNSLQDNT